MQINRSGAKRKKIIIIVLATIIVAILGAAGYFFISNQNSNTERKSETLKTDASDIKNNEVDVPKVATEPDSKKPLESSDENGNASPQTAPNTTVVFTAANQNGSNLQVRTLISALWSDGTCNLTLTKGAVSIKKTAGIQALSGNSTCRGFDIPTSELAPGIWKATLEAINKETSVSATKDIEIK